jgi:AGCS family alanine or glycine:cation symporter
VLTFWYYGSKCSEFVFGRKLEILYRQLYLLLIIVGAVASLSVVINFLTFMYALMAIPTMISTLLLSSKVRAATKAYVKTHLSN